jgi:hypothetical protein
MAGLDVETIDYKSLFGYSYQGDGILSATNVIFNNKIKINFGTSVTASRDWKG